MPWHSGVPELERLNRCSAILLVTADVENALMEFHKTPTASEGECSGYCASGILISADEAERLALMISRLHLWVFGSNAKFAMRITDYP
jgi:hypothetical protein